MSALHTIFWLDETRNPAATTDAGSQSPTGVKWMSAIAGAGLKTGMCLAWRRASACRRAGHLARRIVARASP